MIAQILYVVLPVFLVIGGGYAASRSGVFSSSAVDGLMVFTQSFAIPCLLFRALVDLDLGAVFDPQLLLSFYTGALVAFALGVLGARRLFRRRPGEAVAIGFGALFSNSVLLGLPIMERAYGPEALAPTFAIISVHAPFCYLVGITLMELVRADGRGFVDTARAIGRALFRNALMIGLLLGFAANVTDIPIPGPVRAGLDMMADAALPAALFGLGGVLTRYAIRASLGRGRDDRRAVARRAPGDHLGPRTRPLRPAAVLRALRGDDRRHGARRQQLRLRQPLRPRPGPGGERHPDRHRRLGAHRLGLARHPRRRRLSAGVDA